MLEAIHFQLNAWYAVLVEFVYARVGIGDSPFDSVDRRVFPLTKFHQ